MAEALRVQRAGYADGQRGVEQVKRDRDLQRQLMLRIENCESQAGLAFFEKRLAPNMGLTSEDFCDVEDLDPSTSYNLKLLSDHGFVVGRYVGNLQYYNLTSAGHDVLDGIRSENLWTRLKNMTPREAGDLIRSTLTSTVSAGVARLLGLN